MIAFVEHPEALASFSGNAFACRIRATAAAYGFAHPFARFWVQGRGAALCLLDDVMILDARAGADFDELAAFLPAAGARTVLCSAEAAQALPFPRRATGEIMALRERAAPVEEAEILWDPSPRLLYPLLCASQTASFLPPPFEHLSHRLVCLVYIFSTRSASFPFGSSPFSKNFLTIDRSLSMVCPFAVRRRDG